MSLHLYLLENEIDEEELFRANVTHNLTDMADRLGVYQLLWKTEGVERAKDMLPALNEAIFKLASNQHGYADLNPKNGWGSTDSLLSFMRKVRGGCEEFPEAFVHA